jgi:hypothetical protein
MTQRRRFSLNITFKLRKGSILKNIKQSNFVDSPVVFEKYLSKTNNKHDPI